jgi:hypothetical protein
VSKSAEIALIAALAADFVDLGEVAVRFDISRCTVFSLSGEGLVAGPDTLS